MNLLQLVLTLVLVAGGLFVYDTFLAEHPDPATPASPVAPRVDPPAIRQAEPEPPLRVELQGAGIDGLVARLDELEARIEDFHARERASLAAPGTEAPSTFRSQDLAEGVEPQFDERDLAWFRTMKDEVDRRQRQERFKQMIGNQLKRTGVTLTEEQRQGVIDATISYRSLIRSTYRKEGFRGQAPEERQQALEILKADYEQSLYMLVPAGEADKILEKMGRYPGFSGRQFGGSRPR